MVVAVRLASHPALDDDWDSSFFPSFTQRAEFGRPMGEETLHPSPYCYHNLGDAIDCFTAFRLSFFFPCHFTAVDIVFEVVEIPSKTARTSCFLTSVPDSLGRHLVFLFFLSQTRKRKNRIVLR